MTETAVIVGAGPGLSSSLTYLLLKNKFKVAIAARNVAKLATLTETSNVDVFTCDASNINQVQTLLKNSIKLWELQI